MGKTHHNTPKIPRDAPQVQADSPRAKRIRLKSTTDLDGRTIAAREARTLALAIAADLGGADNLTAIQSTLIDRFVSLTAWAVSQDVAAARGEAFDVTQYATVASTLKRIGETLGLKRQPKDVTDFR